jgi:hypothetical protein
MSSSPRKKKSYKSSMLPTPQPAQQDPPPGKKKRYLDGINPPGASRKYLGLTPRPLNVHTVVMEPSHNAEGSRTVMWQLDVPFNQMIRCVLVWGSQGQDDALYVLLQV